MTKSGGFVTHVQAIVRGTAQLPCDLTPPAPNDSVVLVVWYKDEHTPIYSYDTRGSHSTTAKHWQDGNLDTRAYFRIKTEPSILGISNITEKDEGEYRCRIDYSRSPTKNLRVKLTVIGNSLRYYNFISRLSNMELRLGYYWEDGLVWVFLNFAEEISAKRECKKTV
ncbi:Immunoglobulin V-set domain [Popillia japonica]|uniref:Immunoglobulin V-set domain n=1 Tax=Popillia japonica TaxID=7064 RepID=A0AAW1JI80_POPJA